MKFKWNLQNNFNYDVKNFPTIVIYELYLYTFAIIYYLHKSLLSLLSLTKHFLNLH